jgi:hypothetical protein
MRLIRTLVVAFVGLGLVAAAPSAQAKAEKAAKGHHVHGVVSEVKKDADKDKGTFTVHIPEHKNKKTGETKPAEDKTFQVTEATKFIEVSGNKGETKEEAATFAQLKEGEIAVVAFKGDEAVEVKFHAKHGKKNK